MCSHYLCIPWFQCCSSQVWNSLPFGICDSSSIHTFHRLPKTHCYQQALGSPSGSPKCLRFGLWLTLCTLNIHLLTYLLTYLTTSTCVICVHAQTPLVRLVWVGLSYVKLNNEPTTHTTVLRLYGFCLGQPG